MSPAARFRGLPLRSRLALLVTVAVALAVAAVASVSWFMVRTQLNQQLNSSLRSTNARAQASQTLNQIRCQDKVPGPFENNLSAQVQIVLPTGGRCWVDGKNTLPVSGYDLEVAKGLRGATLYDGKTTDGTPVRIYTQPVELTSGPNVQNAAISVAKPSRTSPNRCPPWPGSCCSSAASASWARARPACGWRARGCARSTN